MIKIELRDFLKWAFCEELAHVATDGGSFAWSMMASFAALGTVIDTSGIGGAGLPELANVDPDALAANEAVMLLAAETFDLPEGWHPCPDIEDPHGLIATCIAEVLDRRALAYGGDRNNNLIALVIASAMIGKEPEWRIPQPHYDEVRRNGSPAWFVRQVQKDRFGRPYEFETNGFDPRTRRPMAGAYRKYELQAPFASAVQARIDWYLWSAAMERLAERLQNGLKSHLIKPFNVAREPWLETPISEASAQVPENAAE